MALVLPSIARPIEATWMEPVTGIEVFAAQWNEAPGTGGSSDAPAARHVYNTSSTAAGYLGRYPVNVDLLGVGEHQVRVLDGVWTDWTRYASTLIVNPPDFYKVVEVAPGCGGDGGVRLPGRSGQACPEHLACPPDWRNRQVENLTAVP